MENQHEHLSEAELKQRKDEMLKFYKDSMPYIKAQLAYEEILTKIEEQRFKRATYQLQWASMMQAPEDEEELINNNPPTPEPISENDSTNSKSESPKKRKLKTE